MDGKEIRSSIHLILYKHLKDIPAYEGGTTILIDCEKASPKDRERVIKANFIYSPKVNKNSLCEIAQ